MSSIHLCGGGFGFGILLSKSCISFFSSNVFHSSYKLIRALAISCTLSMSTFSSANQAFRSFCRITLQAREKLSVIICFTHRALCLLDWYNYLAICKQPIAIYRKSKRNNTKRLRLVSIDVFNKQAIPISISHLPDTVDTID